ncbi:unnamed protein product [Schistosoma margrebowiei]|uniref:Uncharacterized protein n=1 Tax=Schistosoma margrebowiei TaxID=48269 RepID=A0A183MB06_9TREM|nr:unnamed protein product [Schistosoma margrebowiei]
MNNEDPLKTKRQGFELKNIYNSKQLSINQHQSHNLQNECRDAESTKPGIGLISKPIITSEDATIRFIKLKDDFNKIQLNQRLILLKQLNYSRTIELFYLNKQINEFKLHYEHLQRINSLLPSIESGCFYIGKGIEGDQYERRNS